MVYTSRLLPLLGGALCAYAYQDTSPFFYVSTVEHVAHGSSPDVPQLVRSGDLLQSLKPRLSQCTSEAYIIASQPGVHHDDFSTASVVPHLRRLMTSTEGQAGGRASFQIPDVLGRLDVDELESFLQRECKAEIMTVDSSTGWFRPVEGLKPQVVRVEFPALPLAKESRASQLQGHDAYLSSIIDFLSGSKYTVVYTTTPVFEQNNDATAEQGPRWRTVHELEEKYPELRRRMALADDHDENQQHNVTLVDGPLFRRYQFFTPGLFMCLLVAFFLLGILSVGINALESLKVSYAAFDKAMGPTAYKKQQ